MYKISARIGSVDGSESWTDLCHPAFAMAGALAWQVKKINKKEGFGGSEGKTAWEFFSLCPGSSPPVCALCPAFFILLYICLPANHTRILVISNSNTQSPTKVLCT